MITQVSDFWEGVLLKKHKEKPPKQNVYKISTIRTLGSIFCTD